MSCRLHAEQLCSAASEVMQIPCDKPAPSGGSPIGFDVGAKGAGGTLPGLDLVRLLPAWSCCSMDTARESVHLHLAMPCRWCAQCE